MIARYVVSFLKYSYEENPKILKKRILVLFVVFNSIIIVLTWLLFIRTLIHFIKKKPYVGIWQINLWDNCVIKWNEINSYFWICHERFFFDRTITWIFLKTIQKTSFVQVLFDKFKSNPFTLIRSVNCLIRSIKPAYKFSKLLRFDLVRTGFVISKGKIHHLSFLQWSEKFCTFRSR